MGTLWLQSLTISRFLGSSITTLIFNISRHCVKNQIALIYNHYLCPILNKISIEKKNTFVFWERQKNMQEEWSLCVNVYYILCTLYKSHIFSCYIRVFRIGTVLRSVTSHTIATNHRPGNWVIGVITKVTQGD